MAQQRGITGTVTDRKDNSAMIGVNIMEKGTLNGTITDIDGNFSLNVTTENPVLVLSSIGYKTQEVVIGNQPRLSIFMEEDTELLDEVVVVGYGSMKKSDLTGSVASVKTEKLNAIPANSIEGLLQGRVAGMQVINSSQDPGAGATVRIRGNSSLRGSNSPLLVVDGFPFGDAGDLKQINPQDIVSMEVLKDASASAIYGSRGANGVILVTTRRAKQSTTQVTIHQQTTLSEFTSELNLWRDPVLMAMLSNEANINAGLTPTYIGAVNAAGIYYPSIEELQTTWTTNTRWDDIVLRPTPVSNNTTIQVASSTDRTNFIVSANYYRDNGIYIKDSYTKYGANFSVEHKVFDNFRAKFSSNVVKNKRHNNGWLSYGRNPIFPVYNEDGSYFQYSANDYYHPLAITNLQKNESSGLDVISFGALDWQITNALNIRGQFNYKHGESVSDQYSPKKYTETGTFNNGYGSINNWKDDNFVIEAYATFDKNFDRHHLTAMGGYSYENYQSRSSFLAAKDFVNESLQNENLASGNPQTYEISNGFYKTELVSGLARVNYAFDDRYLATFTARMDGSTKFGKDDKWAYFPSGALSWKAQEEEFIKNLNVFDVLKLRASYGYSGNQGISAYQTLSRYGQHKYFNNGAFVTAIGPGYQSGTTGQDGIFAVWSGIPNAGLKWENTSQLDLGLEMSFFRNRLNITFDWYNKHTFDLLRERNIAPSSGYDRMWVNDGEIQNRGIELTADGTIYRNKDLRIGGTLIYARNRNKVLSLGNSVEVGLNTDVRTGMQYENYGNSSEQFRSFSNILAIGQPMYVFYGYKTEGIVQSLAEGLDAGLTGEDVTPGEFKYINIYDGDGLGVVDENDRTIIGDPNPDWTGSLNLEINYKRFDFSIFFNGVFGNDVINTQRFNQPSNQPLRWTPDNPTNDYPRLNANRQVKFSDWWIEDGSFVRIQNMSLGYTFPFLNSQGSIRVYSNISNLYTFSKFSGYDPEVGVMGMYSGGYPRLRKWTFGVNFTF
jgi:TonB-linked SusC/RagA family outer membrane protein